MNRSFELKSAKVVGRQRSAKVAHVHVEGGAVDGHYCIDANGLNAAEIAQRVRITHEHHDKRAARVDGFRQNVQGEQFTVAGLTYRIVDCTIFYHPDGRFRHVLMNVRVLIDDAWQQADNFPARLTYRTIDDVPDDEELKAIARERVSKIAHSEAADIEADVLASLPDEMKKARKQPGRASTRTEK